jgi:hypothetical protein
LNHIGIFSFDYDYVLILFLSCQEQIVIKIWIDQRVNFRALAMLTLARVG